MDDLYLVLGVEQDAKPEEIRERFRFLAQAYHPDKFSSPTQKLLAEEEFKRINNAYQILSDLRKRADYDLRRKSTANYSRTNTYDVNGKAEEMARQRAQEEQKRRAEEVARQRAQEEQKRKAEEAARQHAQEEQKRKAEEAARQHAKSEQKRKTEEAVRNRVQEESKNRPEEATRQWIQPSAKKRTKEVAPQRVMWAVIFFFLLFGVLFALPKTENKLSSTTRIEVETSSPPAGTELETPSLNSNDLRIMQTAEIRTHPSPFLDEDFSDERLVNDNWQFAADVDNLKQADIFDGKLMMGVSNDTQILYMPVTYSDVVIQVDITRISGKGYAGLVCRFEEVYFEYLSLFYFLLSENSTPSFIYNDVYKEEGVGFPFMDGLFLPDAVVLSLSEDSTNTLMVVCRGNSFSAYINDRLVSFAEVDMKYISPGYGGVMVVSVEESEYSFDNFSISKP